MRRRRRAIAVHDGRLGCFQAEVEESAITSILRTTRAEDHTLAGLTMTWRMDGSGPCPCQCPYMGLLDSRSLVNGLDYVNQVSGALWDHEHCPLTDRVGWSYTRTWPDWYSG